LQVLDLAAQRANIIDQNQERIGVAAHASPAPALCTLASRSASSPAISFWSTSRVACLRRVDASHLEILGSFRASVVTMAPTMIFRRVSLAFWGLMPESAESYAKAVWSSFGPPVFTGEKDVRPPEG
jgi:hypothetical protein